MEQYESPGVILLATDSSDSADAAANEAISLSRTTGSKLHVVHVWHDVPTTRFHEFVRNELERAGREILDKWVERLEKDGAVVAEPHLVEGHAADEIVRLGEELGADAIVVGSRDPGLVRRAVLGSVSSEVARRASTPVLVVNRKKASHINVEQRATLERSA